MTLEINHLSYAETITQLAEAGLMVIGFLMLLWIASLRLPGKTVAGATQVDNSQKLYKLNGLTLFMGSTIAIAITILGFHWSLLPIYTHFWSLFIIANLVAVIVTGLLYLKGKRSRTSSHGVEKTAATPIRSTPQLSHPKPQWQTFLSELWFGVELNPTWRTVDLKMFAYQPSLIGLGF
jgi:Delta14-sterol reductase